jgi:hypothetical protein
LGFGFVQERPTQAKIRLVWGTRHPVLIVFRIRVSHPSRKKLRSGWGTQSCGYSEDGGKKEWTNPPVKVVAAHSSQHQA